MAKILCVGAHPDDIELGMGGTINRLVSEGHEIATFTLSTGREGQNLWHARIEAEALLGVQSPGVSAYCPDQQFDTIPLLSIIQHIETAIGIYEPSVVYTHSGGDLNEDHRIVHQAVLTACRPLPNALVKEIYAFEVLSSSEWGAGFKPTMYSVISFDNFLRKFHALKHYESEMRAFPHPRSGGAVRVLAALRGSQCGHEFAEAFEVIRCVR